MGKNGFANFFVFAKIVFAKNVCPRSGWLRGHNVGVVIDYAYTTMTTRTLSENFEGFSQIWKK